MIYCVVILGRDELKEDIIAIDVSRVPKNEEIKNPLKETRAYHIWLRDREAANQLKKDINSGHIKLSDIHELIREKNNGGENGKSPKKLQSK